MDNVGQTEPLTCFNAYDVRGKLGVNLDTGIAYRIGRAVGQHFGAGNLTSHDLTRRQICNLVSLMNGGFNPLTGFLSEEDYNGVVENMRLADGKLWPMQITLDVKVDFADKIELGQDIALRDQ